MVTETLRAPITAVGDTVTFAVNWVELLIVNELTVISDEKPGVVTPFANPVSVITISSVAPSAAVVGEMLPNVGAGFPAPPAVHFENPPTPVSVIVFAEVFTVPPCAVHVDPPSVDL